MRDIIFGPFLVAITRKLDRYFEMGVSILITTPPRVVRVRPLLGDYIIYTDAAFVNHHGAGCGLSAVIIGPARYRNSDSMRVEYAIQSTVVSPII